MNTTKTKFLTLFFTFLANLAYGIQLDIAIIIIIIIEGVGSRRMFVEIAGLVTEHKR